MLWENDMCVFYEINWEMWCNLEDCCGIDVDGVWVLCLYEEVLLGKEKRLYLNVSLYLGLFLENS